MILKYNKKFENLVGTNFSIEQVEPCKASSFIKNEDILCINDSYYFKRFAPTKKMLPPVDKMIDEFDTNKIRVDDIINTKVTSSEAFWCGLTLVKEVVNKLQNSFGNGFAITLSYNYQHCYIRFYKIREGSNNVTSDNLEGFKSEAILRVII